MPSKIVEWIPYSNLENIKYLTKGGFSEIYTAISECLDVQLSELELNEICQDSEHNIES
ncbi:hypothetical protein RhiirC2_785099 [Rhizophagus irregularis]|uniref:Protein kinase domain-containing protein n=1 Tax=Rhizophagus irregularis TaxID=588596 RepID=A0A2N1MX28_9GLOM|nr:hypothetical protein RhiirC2_785099 [Rhizophagus irregularis]